ncbi:MAG: metal ABC transporter substrate-binding protein [Nitrospirota bacterium]|nr:metal ABC transporter substrate-binding protein [Nitrospirota bacterium]
MYSKVLLDRRLIVILLFFAFIFIGCEKVPASKKVVATTSFIGTIAKAIGKDRVNVVTLVPGGMCPGHFDLKPDDILAITDAMIILNHGWEMWIKFLNSMEKKGSIRTINIQGSWMIPEVHIRVTNEITRILAEVDPQNSKWYEKNSVIYKREVELATIKVKEEVKPFQNVKAVSSEHQAEFLRWLGFDVVATYKRPEELTPKGLIEIIQRAKREGVQVVVDNLQSGPKTGEQIAIEIGARHVVLTNFPLGDSYIGCLKENVGKVIKACKWQGL